MLLKRLRSVQSDPSYRQLWLADHDLRSRLFGATHRDQQRAAGDNTAGNVLGPISIAPSSLAVEAKPDHTMIWIGALAGQMVVQLSITGDCAITEEYLFRKQLGRIRDVGSDAGGALYMVRYTY